MDALDLAKKPGGQLLQDVAPKNTWTTSPPPDSDALVDAYFPRPQAAQALEPWAEEMNPAPQAAHFSGLVSPMRGDAVPLGQSVHASERLKAAYWPAAHSAQPVAPAPAYQPGRQLLGHTAFASTLVDQVPAAQLTHAVAAIVFE